MKKFIILIFLIFSVPIPVIAKEKIKVVANISQKFTLSDIPKSIQFVPQKEINFKEVTIPESSLMSAKVLDAESERRWHRSGFIILNAEDYVKLTGQKINIEKENIYLIARKYEKVSGKEIAKDGAEFIVTTAASFFIPCIDIAYYFVKGAIKREKYSNWFKSGVSTAYDNSICWIWLKGKAIDLENGESIILKRIDKEKAYKLKSRIEKSRAKKQERESKKLKNNSGKLVEH